MHACIIVVSLCLAGFLLGWKGDYKVGHGCALSGWGFGLWTYKWKLRSPNSYHTQHLSTLLYVIRNYIIQSNSFSNSSTSTMPSSTTSTLPSHPAPSSSTTLESPKTGMSHVYVFPFPSCLFWKSHQTLPPNLLHLTRPKKTEQSAGKPAWKPRYDRRQSWDPQDKRREMQMRATAVGAVQTGAGFTEADK